MFYNGDIFIRFTVSVAVAESHCACHHFASVVRPDECELSQRNGEIGQNSCSIDGAAHQFSLAFGSLP